MATYSPPNTGYYDPNSNGSSNKPTVVKLDKPAVHSTMAELNKPAVHPTMVEFNKPAAVHPTMVEFNKPVVHPTNPQATVVPVYNNFPGANSQAVDPVYNNFLPGANSQAVDPATGIPYMVVTTRREGCTCSWEMAVSIAAILLILVGSVLLGVGLSNCAYYCYLEDYNMYCSGIALLCIGIVMGISVIVAFLVRRNRVTTTTMQPFRQYQP
ncbi:8128_t:CDS:1 [Paraglomus brasilianum]|uniref:8128_t:CDS:1 n=1 Tax=Paraglomus brasilianum TaxID=144538 RepID=A0A9N9EWI1_9GLOM|nr:8128_t:CDS:1 [Paraglomus brasilianum]